MKGGGPWRAAAESAIICTRMQARSGVTQNVEDSCGSNFIAWVAGAARSGKA